MIAGGIKQSDKAKVFDWLVEKLEDGTLEMLFKKDSTGAYDFDSVSNFEGLIGELEVQSQSLKRNKSANHVVLTISQFDDIRKEIYSSYSRAGCMDHNAAKTAEKAFRSLSTVETKNLISPLTL
ncbi:hypothetical protein L1D14_07255 [Vibrio tubiashii]|uniref:hypothetical protein n=1 Tax=Vibrio tubiashii TaxID=29498 RepID=UPI001EFD2369|nr:hypothetical protein [Vibrio tubiashii]MCG9576034.1 hypothetical protein [Vibrio tubiashii]